MDRSLFACMSACRDKTTYIRISLDPGKVGFTLGVVIVVVDG